MELGRQRRKLFIYIAVIIIVTVLLIWFVFGGTNDSGELEKGTIILTNSADEQIEVSVEIADTDEERHEGLMHRESLCEDCGMLFVYKEDVHNGFWMKDTQIPLSIAFIDEEGRIMEIQQMEPETTDTHKPAEPYRYALEVNRGFFAENNVDAGDHVSMPEQYN